MDLLPEHLSDWRSSPVIWRAVDQPSEQSPNLVGEPALEVAAGPVAANDQSIVVVWGHQQPEPIKCPMPGPSRGAQTLEQVASADPTLTLSGLPQPGDHGVGPRRATDYLVDLVIAGHHVDDVRCGEVNRVVAIAGSSDGRNVFTVGDRSRIVISRHRDIPDGLQHLSLVADCGEDGRLADAGTLCDLVNGGRPVPLGNEQLTSGGEYGGATRGGLRRPERGVVATLIDIGHVPKITLSTYSLDCQ